MRSLARRRRSRAKINHLYHERADLLDRVRVLRRIVVALAIACALALLGHLGHFLGVA